MNRTRTNNRFSRTRTGGGYADGSGGGDRGSRFGSPAPGRSGGTSRPGGYGGGRRPAAVRGEFALPTTITPALPAVEAFADLDMPEQLLSTLGAEGVTVPFPIQGATLP